MTDIIFATNNLNKLKEAKSLLQDFNILSLADIGLEGDIPETQDTLIGNALQKANFIFEKTKTLVFSDDTGLEVEILNGAPGVYSARYAGLNCSSDDNMNKLLVELRNKKNRLAKFKTVIAFVDGKNECFFEGVVNGTILNEKHGEKGFGYDPLFQPEGYNVSFAQMTLEQKNEISHRGRALKKFIDFLQKY